MELSNPSVLKGLLNKHNFHFTKSLGQNFLVDGNVLQKIISASGINESSNVIEIGAGAGTLTSKLCQSAKKVVSIEIDKALLPILSETAPHAKIICQDVLKVDMKALIKEEFNKGEVHVAANLPYYITTPIIMKFLEERVPIASMTVMVQKEVARRMTAAAGGKDYGALSVAVQYYSRPEIICQAEPHCFIPQPKVASEVVRLEVLPEPSVAAEDEEFFFKVVRASFGQRRKTLVNSLLGGGITSLCKNDILSVITDMGLRADVRGETLTPAHFANLSDRLLKKATLISHSSL